MQKYLPVLRARRERRLQKQNKQANNARGAILSGGIVLSLLLGVFIILGAFATRNRVTVSSGWKVL